MLESIDPSTGAVWATVPRSDASDIADAVTAARARVRDWWRTLPALARAGHLRRLADVMRAHADELAEIETRDNGRIIVETTLFDLPACTEMLFYFAGAADKISGDTVQIGPTSFNFTIREPIGVVGLDRPVERAALDRHRQARRRARGGQHRRGEARGAGVVLAAATR